LPSPGPPRETLMSESKMWRVRPADLRRMAKSTREAEKERKMLVLAEQLEEIDRLRSGRGDDPSRALPDRADTPVEPNDCPG
jgi:hypothetical protein